MHLMRAESYVQVDDQLAHLELADASSHEGVCK